jgi:hypothetical protein
MREIVREPSNRFDWWIMKTFNVLPTDERYLSLTSEQKDFIWENFLVDHPEDEKKIKNKMFDPDFDEEWEALGKEKSDGDDSDVMDDIDDDDDFSDIQTNYAKFLKSRPDLELEVETQKKEAPTPSDKKTEDWEEV